MEAIKLCRLDTPIIFIEARINLSRFVVTGCAAKTSATVTFPSLNLISLFAFCFNIWLNGVASSPSLVSWIKHSVDRFVIVSIFIPKLRLILILNSFLGSSDSLVFSELFHSLAPRPLAARSISDFLTCFIKIIFRLIRNIRKCQLLRHGSDKTLQVGYANHFYRSAHKFEQICRHRLRRQNVGYSNFSQPQSHLSFCVLLQYLVERRRVVTQLGKLD